MSRETKRDGADLRLLLRFIHETVTAAAVEQVYANALNLVQDLFSPNRAFVALSEANLKNAQKSELHPGWLLDLGIPIQADGKVVGQIMLQYNEPRGFSEQDLAILEIIAAQAGFFIQRLQERQS
jgi:GAF domain-containing protein